MHDWFTPLARLVKVTLRGVWVVRPVGADQIGHGAEGFVACHSGPVAPRALWENVGLENATTPPNGKQGGTITRHPASNLERDDLG